MKLTLKIDVSKIDKSKIVGDGIEFRKKGGEVEEPSQASENINPDDIPF